MRGRRARIARGDQAKARELVTLYRKTHEGITNIDVWLIMNADNTRRANAQLLSELKAAQAKAPAYLYFFNWRSPVHKGQMKAYHTLDIPFAFYNVDQAASMTGAMQDRYALAHRMSAAFAAFARSGNPNHADLPTWPKWAAGDWTIRPSPTVTFPRNLGRPDTIPPRPRIVWVGSRCSSVSAGRPDKLSETVGARGAPHPTTPRRSHVLSSSSCDGRGIEPEFPRLCVLPRSMVRTHNLLRAPGPADAGWS